MISKSCIALRGLMKLLDEGELVRNTDRDWDAMAFMRQGVKITNAIRAATEALELEDGKPRTGGRAVTFEQACDIAYAGRRDTKKSMNYKLSCFDANARHTKFNLFDGRGANCGMIAILTDDVEDFLSKAWIGEIWWNGNWPPTKERIITHDPKEAV